MQLKQWIIANGRSIVHSVLIVSYKMLQLYASKLDNIEISLMLCDESHHLKNGESQTFQALTKLKVVH